MNRTHAVIGTLFALALGTSACSSAGPSRRAAPQADTSGDQADTSCEVVLREMGQSTLNGGEIFQDNHADWVVFRGDIDVDSNLLGSGVTVGVWYASNFGQVDVQASTSQDPTLGLEGLHGGLNPPPGYTRFSFATTTDTTEAGDDQVEPLQVIPYVAFPDGHRLYDHNRTAGNYAINSSSYAVFDDFSVCPAPLGGTTPPPPPSCIADGTASAAGDGSDCCSGNFNAQTGYCGN
jgi:hypothetical protein